MEREKLLKYCRYYKGEEIDPFVDGRSVWWKIESYGVYFGDKTFIELSPTMIDYIRERVWQSDSGWNTTWDEALKRAKELYRLGKWSVGYISQQEANISIAY